MAYGFTSGGQATVTATELVVSQYDQIQAEFEDVKYPEVLYDTQFDQASVKTDINPGAMNVVYRTRDVKGTGNFVNGNSRNIPRVGQVIGQVTVPILDAAVGFTLMDAEARRYAFAYQGSLAQDMGGIMKRATEYHKERAWFFGDTDANFLPYLDYPTVTKVPIGATWAAGTPTVWVQNILDGIATLYKNSNTLHLPDTVELPIDQFSMLQQAFVIGAGTAGVACSALKYLTENNLYTALTGKPLKVTCLRYLKGVGVAGANRCIIKDSNAANVMLPLPLPYQLAQPVPIALGVEGFAEYIFGSFHMKRPLSMIYLDGI